MKKLFIMFFGLFSIFSLTGCYSVSGVRADSNAVGVIAPIHLANIVDDEEEFSEAFQRIDKNLVIALGLPLNIPLKINSAEESWQVESVSDSSVIEIGESEKKLEQKQQLFEIVSKKQGEAKIVFVLKNDKTHKKEYLKITVK